MKNHSTNDPANLKQQLGDFLDKETELAKAELVPSAKSAGKGAGMFGVAALFGAHAIWMLLLALSSLFIWLFTLLGLSTAISFILGFLASAVVALIIAGVFALIGKQAFGKVKAPTATIAEFKATVSALSDGWARKDDPSLPVQRTDLTPPTAKDRATDATSGPATGRPSTGSSQLASHGQKSAQ